MRTRTAASLLVALFGSACSDYGISRKGLDADGPDPEPWLVDTASPRRFDPCHADEWFPPGEVPIDEDCRWEPTIGTLDPTIEWSMDSFPGFTEFHEVLTTPVVGQLTDDDGDGFVGFSDIPDIVFIADKGYNSGNLHGVLRIVSGDGSRTHLTLTEYHQDDWVFYPYQYSSVAIGDIDADGAAEIVFVAEAIYEGTDTGGGGGEIPVPDTGAGGGETGEPEPDEVPVRNREEEAGTCTVVAFDTRGQMEWFNDEQGIVCAGHTPSITDMEGDGIPEVILGRMIMNGVDGSVVALGDRGVGAYIAYPDVGYSSFALDMDVDGIQELVTGVALYGPDGGTICNVDDGLSDGFPAAADLDGDGEGEFVVVGNGTVRVHDTNCALMHDWEINGGGNGGPPTVADFDGDGDPEIGVVGALYYSVYEVDGTRLWSASVTDESSHATGSSVFDFDGDGSAEVVYADEVALWVYDGATGAVRIQDDNHTSRTLHDYPVIVDVDGDGQTEIVIPNGGTHSDTEAVGLYVIGSADGSWRANRQVWNQHAYSITNINDDLSIPQGAAPNWPTYNNFRSGDINPLSASLSVDAVPVLSGICTENCDEGVVSVSYQIGNSGLADMRGGVPITLYAKVDGNWVPLETSWSAGIVVPGSTSQGFTLELDSTVMQNVPLRLVADDDGQGGTYVTECDEDNNTFEIEAGICDGASP